MKETMKDKIIKYLQDNCPSLEISENINTEELAGAVERFAKKYTHEILDNCDWVGGDEVRKQVDEFVPSESFLAPPEPERLLSVPLWQIKLKCGWIRWCEVVGGDEWMLSEYPIDENDIFHATESQLYKLGWLPNQD